MNALDKELLRIIRSVRDRIHAALIINSMILGTAAALLLGILIAAAAWFIPLYNVYVKIFYITAAAASCGFLYSAFRTPRDTCAALAADSSGLEERTVTALELAGDYSAFAMLEKNDALKHLKGTELRKIMPIRPNKKYLTICIILSIILLFSGFVPNPMTEKAEELHKIKTEIAKQQKNADRLAEKVKSNPNLSEEQKKELEQKLLELKKELKEARDVKDINKALGRAEKKMEYIRDKYDPGENMNKIIDILSKNETTKALADMIKKGDEKAFRDSIKKMAETLRQLSPEEKQKLAEKLSQLAREIKNNPELGRAFSELSKKLASGELGDISGELGELDQGISELMGNENIRAAISELIKELGSANTGGEAAGHQGQDNGQGSSEAQGQGNQQSENGQGNGQGTGQGNRQGNGQGSGAGSGTDQGNENQTPVTPGTSGIGKKGGSTKKDGEYEKIFTPDTLGGEGEASNLSGKKGKGGTVEQIIDNKGLTVRGNSVPYNQVAGQYKDRAMEGMSTSDIPPGMKDMIKEYFVSLEE